MNYSEIFTAIELDYNKDIAMYSCMCIAVHLSIKIKKSDLVQGKFTKRLNNKIDNLLWFLDTETKTTVLSCYRVAFTWQQRKDLRGIGGCEMKTIKQLIEGADYENVETIQY